MVVESSLPKGSSPLQVALQAVLASIPVVGSALEVSLSAYLQEKKEKRWREFLSSLAEKLDHIDQAKVDSDYFQTDEFFDRMEVVYNDVIAFADSEKADYLRAYVIGCAQIAAPDTSWIEIYTQHLIRMTGAHLRCLHVVFKLQGQLSETERFLQASDTVPLRAKRVQGELGSQWDDDLVEIIFSDLVSFGLVRSRTNSANEVEFGWSITNLGIKFMKFLDVELPR